MGRGGWRSEAPRAGAPSPGTHMDDIDGPLAEVAEAQEAGRLAHVRDAPQLVVDRVDELAACAGWGGGTT